MSMRVSQSGIIQNQSTNFEANEQMQQQNTPQHKYARDDNYQRDMSEWMAKKNLQQSEKQIDLILNRINLLKKEEERTLKKIEDTKGKTDKVLEMKLRNQEYNQQKNYSKQNNGEYLKLLQRKSYEMRRQQKEEREAIRNALVEMKTEECNEVKKQRDLNQKRIEEIKNKQKNENREKREKVKVLESESRQKVELYWVNHMDNIQRESMQRKHTHLKTKTEKDLLLQRLEKQEFELIQRLEQSQNLHFNAQRELESVAQMPNSEVSVKYPNKGSNTPNGFNTPKGQSPFGAMRGYSNSASQNFSQFSKLNDVSRRKTQDTQSNVSGFKKKTEEYDQNQQTQNA